MKRNLDLVMAILNKARNGDRHSVAINIDDFGVPANELLEALLLSSDGGFIVFFDRESSRINSMRSMGHEEQALFPIEIRLTWRGHDYLDVQDGIKPSFFYNDTP